MQNVFIWKFIYSRSPYIRNTSHCHRDRLGTLTTSLLACSPYEACIRTPRIYATPESLGPHSCVHWACRAGQYRMNLFCFLLLVWLRSVASDDTRLAFHSFPSEDDSIITLRDAAYNRANRSYIIDGRTTPSRGSCGALIYTEKVRIQDVATGRVASFSTSFSFTFEALGSPRDNNSSLGVTDHSGIAFVLFRSMMGAEIEALMSKIGSAGACRSPLHPSDPNHRYTPSGFLICFAMGKYSPDFEETSNSYIRVSKNRDYEYDRQEYTHNLCDNGTRCSYFSDGKNFTAWIDFNSSARTLEVRLANGSNSSAKKPSQPLLLIPNYKLAEILGDVVIPMFWGSSDVQRVEAHELLSWNFFSTEISNVPSSQTPNRFWKARTWAGISTGVLGMVLAAAVVILWCASRLASPSKIYRYSPFGHSVGPHVFSYAELRMATDNFHERNLLGVGGSGSVYKGSFEIPGGKQFVAVKQINFLEPLVQAESLFHAEVAGLGQIRHRNVVQLQGWCQEKGRLLLVYDFMPNGSLNKWLHSPGSHGPQHQEIVLSLERRHSILQGVGVALEYLHEDCLSCVLHRDIKSSNVLLDADFNAHLGDFGLARLMDHLKLDKTTLAGTLGYMAPEMPYIGKATKQSDVFSFGILVLEVVCGRRPLDMQATKPENLVLLHTVWRAHEGGSLLNLVDPRLLQTLQPLRFIPQQEDEDAIGPPLPIDSNLSSDNNVLGSSMVVDVDVQVHTTMVVDLLRVGLLCCLPNPKARPSMGQVNGILQQIRDMENASTITNISMPSLPATKPWGLYYAF